MNFTVDNYEIIFHADQPDCVQIIDTTTQSSTFFTIDEAFGMLKTMLKNYEDLSMVRMGK